MTKRKTPSEAGISSLAADAQFGNFNVNIDPNQFDHIAVILVLRNGNVVDERFTPADGVAFDTEGYLQLTQLSMNRAGVENVLHALSFSVEDGVVSPLGLISAGDVDVSSVERRSLAAIVEGDSGQIEANETDPAGYTHATATAALSAFKAAFPNLEKLAKAGFVQAMTKGDTTTGHGIAETVAQIIDLHYQAGQRGVTLPTEAETVAEMFRRFPETKALWEKHVNA